MKEFPWEVVHDHFAKKLVEVGVKDHQTLPPMMATVTVEDERITSIEMLPRDQVGRFFTSPNGKDALGYFLQIARQVLPDNVCIVLISEAYMRATNSKEEFAKIAKGSLQNDEKAVEIIMINMNTRDETQIGRIEITPDRSLVFCPFKKRSGVAGRFTANPDVDPLV